MRCVRIWFNKTGDAKYISHLDLMRAFTRAVRRAKIPLWFTEGFNPRPYMQFALPLSLGMESLCESADIRIEGEMTDAEIEKRLRSVMPSGLEIKRVTSPQYDAKYICYGEFDIVFSGSEDVMKLKSLIDESLTGNELTVQKLSKKGRGKEYKEINLLEHILRAETKIRNNAAVCTLVLHAGSSVNVNPSLFSDKICALCGEDLSVDIIRKKLLLENGEEFR